MLIVCKPIPKFDGNIRSLTEMVLMDCLPVFTEFSGTLRFKFGTVHGKAVLWMVMGRSVNL